MTTKQDVARWAEVLNGAINNVAQRVKQNKFNEMFQQGMQPQQNTQWNAPAPMRGINPGVQSALNAPLPQTTTTQPNMLEVLGQIVSQNPEMVPYAQPLIQNQYNTAMAAKAPWMEQGRGGLATNMVTGQQISNPMESAPPAQKNATTIGTGNTKTEKGIVYKEVIAADPITQTPLPGAKPRWEMAGQESKAGSGSWKADTDPMGNIKGWYNLSTKDYMTPKDLGLGDKLSGTLTGTTRTMVETAPKVRQLAETIKSQVVASQGRLGAIKGRWSDLMTGKIGFDDPEYNKLRVNANLISTLLMRMHMGARGGQQIQDKFQKLVGLGEQSAGNMLSAMDEIINYAQQVENEGKEGTNTGGQTQIPSTNSKGWVLHTDANGNKAYVSPDGKQFEEIK
jgi:hypothetical protein